MLGARRGNVEVKNPEQGVDEVGVSIVYNLVCSVSDSTLMRFET